MFEQEKETYKRALPQLLREPGRFALICGDQINAYDTWRDACQVGYEKYGAGHFYVKEVKPMETPEYIGYPLPSL